VQILAWRDSLPDQKVSNRPFFTKIRPAADAAPLATAVHGLAPGRYRVSIRITGFRHNDAYSAYLEMGRPAALSAEQLTQLKALTEDRPAISTVDVGADGVANIRIPMRDQDVVLMELDRT
jgi:xylan 1,4-beta-xylosidase